MYAEAKSPGPTQPKEISFAEFKNNVNNIHHPLTSYRDTQLLHAQSFNEDDSNEEMYKIYHLVEAHCPVFRKTAINLYNTATHNSSRNIFPLNAEHLVFNCATEASINNKIEDILCKMELMPSEWTLVQLTSHHLNISGPVMPSPLQITVFECGQSNTKPFTIEVDSPQDSWGNSINILGDFNDFIEEINKGYVQVKSMHPRGYKESYSEYKFRINNTMKQFVKDVQNKWLGAWRCLLTGKFSEIENEMKVEKYIKKLLQEHKKCDISKKTREILKYLLRAQAYLDPKESKKILKYCFPEITKEEVIRILNNIKVFESYVKLTRNPVILIVDAIIDQIPWEMIDVFANQSVSRMQSFYITYALFDAHETEIVNGRKVIPAGSFQGGAMLNPSLNLSKMENRLSGFHSYWTKKWRIMIGKRPTEADFLEFVTNCDVFNYCGHGDGMQYVKATSIEKLRINAVVFLFGCRSVAFKKQLPLNLSLTYNNEPWGSSQYYTMCCCPCVIGNLYNVTDFECDKMCTNVLSQWIPAPENKVHWQDIELKSWESGTNVVNIEDLPKVPNKSMKTKQLPDLLLALSKTKFSSNITYATQAACVARGIPIKLV